MKQHTLVIKGWIPGHLHILRAKPDISKSILLKKITENGTIEPYIPEPGD